MEKFSVLFIIMVLAGILTVSCKPQGGSEQKQEMSILAEDQNTPVIYYFHFDRRCATCLAVEEEAGYVSKFLYKGDVPFIAASLDENEGKELAKKLGVTGQSLIVKKGDISFDLTSEAFLIARTDPEKFRELLKEHIDRLF